MIEIDFYNDVNVAADGGSGAATYFWLWEDGGVILAENDNPGGYQTEDAP